MADTPRSYRLGEVTEAELDALSEHLGIKSHAELIRLAIRRMARAELGTLPNDRSKPNTLDKRKGKK